MHEQHEVMHFGKPGKGLVLAPGMTLTIGPMNNQSSAKVNPKRDE